MQTNIEKTNMSGSGNSISVKNLFKNYGNIEALKDLTFDVEKNELFGFIGPDGAGKTSLFRILATLLIPDSGKVKIFEHDIINDFKKLRKIIGYMPGQFSLYHDLTVEENINFFATIFGTTLEENYEIIKDIYIQIEPFKNRLAGKLSGGMKQKLALSCALIHKPKLLILDEPTTGVDAVSRKEFWEILKTIKSKGITIIVSTPYMDEAVLCDRVALIQDGRIMTINTPENILKLFDNKLFALKSNNMYKLLTLLQNWDNTLNAYLSGQNIHLTLKNENTDFLLDYLKSNYNNDVDLQIITPNIEDVFIKLMSKK